MWREKAGALAPLPASVADAAGPGFVERAAQKSLDALGSLKQQAVDAVAQAKQHAATTYYRAVDPTPFAGARPGTAAAIVAGCITFGSGATYCVDQGVNPFRAAQSLISPAKTKDRQPQAEKAQAEPPAPVTTPPPTTPVTEPEPVVAPEPEPAPAPAPEPELEPAPAPEPAPPPPPPPPEQ